MGIERDSVGHNDILLVDSIGKVNMSYSRSEAMSLQNNQLVIDLRICIFCKFPTNRFTIARREGDLWNGIPCCDACHMNVRRLLPEGISG